MRPVQRPLAAICVLPFVGGLLMFSLFTGHYITFSVFCSSLIVACFLYAVASRFGIRLEVQAPSRVNEGDNIGLSLLLRSRSWLPKFISLSTAEVIQPLNIQTREKKRLQQHKLFFRQQNPPKPADEKSDEYLMDGFILRRGLSKIYRQIELLYRGVVTVKRLKLSFSDPLGIFSFSRTFDINHEILVRVKPSAGSALLQVTGSSGRLETKMKVCETGEMTEFAGTRPFRDGDELRHIHWPTVARTDELYVREYTPSSAESVIVILLRNNSTIVPEAPTPPFGEYMLRAALALVIELFNRRIHVAYGSNLNKGQAISVGYSQSNLQTFHDSISAIDWAAGTVDPETFIPRIQAAGMESPFTLVFCLDPPKSTDFQAVSRLLFLNYSRIVAVLPAETGDDRSQLKADVPPGVKTISCSEDDPGHLFSQLSL